MVFEKQRWEVWNTHQHPYRHSLAEFAYSNPAVPGVSNAEAAFNYIYAVLFPNTKPAVATPADLPTGTDTPNPGDVTPTINDYRVVLDDGDGKQAAYRWEQREGEVSASWHKVMDMDWSNDSILAALMDITQPLYVTKGGAQDLDVNGDPIVGLYAGQTINGGTLANQNLTLNANSGDGVGAQTGFVQIDSAFRPVVDNTYDNGTATERWKNGYYGGVVTIGTLTLASGSITDSSGTIGFGDENLITTGNITGDIITGTSLVADDTINTVTLVPGSYTDTSGAIDFGAANLITTGTLGAGVATFTKNTFTLLLDPDNGAGRASITSSQGSIDFVDEDLYTTGSLNVGSLIAGLLDVDNIRIDGNTISSTDVNGNILLVPNGTGIVDIQKSLTTLDQNITGLVTHSGNTGQTGTLGVTGIINIDNLRLDGNTLSITDVNGSLTLLANGTGVINFGASLIPTISGSFDVASAAALLNDIYISGGIRNATNEIAIGTLLAFRSAVYRDLLQTTPAETGDALFYDGVNGVWLASTPDSEVDHATISGLTTGDAGHTQFALLAGRATGQTILGGTGATENLVLGSTAHPTKGTVQTQDNFEPVTTAAFSGGWTGTDLGGTTKRWNDVFSSGEFKGFRLENVLSTALPSASAQNIGRVVWATDNSKAYVDIGATWKVLGVAKYVADQVFDGIITVLNVDVSASIEDARNAQWQLMDNANDFEIMGVTIKVTSATNVRIVTSIPLPASSYRLTGIE